MFLFLFLLGAFGGGRGPDPGSGDPSSELSLRWDSSGAWLPRLAGCKRAGGRTRTCSPVNGFGYFQTQLLGLTRACSRRKVKRQRLPNKGRNTRCYQNKTKQKKKKEEKEKVLVQNPLAKDGEEKGEYL